MSMSMSGKWDNFLFHFWRFPIFGCSDFGTLYLLLFFSGNYTALKKNRLELLELKHLLIQADHFLSDSAVHIADLNAEDTTRKFAYYDGRFEI